jgi:arylsulfatase A-like enzyme
VKFLRSRNPEQPFFLQIGYTETHNPWRGHPERLVSQYRSCQFDHLIQDVAYPFGRQNLESTLPTRLNPREALAQYFAAITQIDEAVSRLLDELEALELRERTLLVFTSDHGLCAGHHGLWGKGNATLPLNMLEESIRVPLIFNQPGRLFDHQRRREFVDHLDLFQTLADYAGISQSLPDDKNYPGRSFLPLLDNSAAISHWRTEQYGEYGNLRMIRTRTHKLVRRYPDGPCELIDLATDPREMTNRFHDPAHQPLVERLTTRLDTHFSQYEDPVKSGLRVLELPRHNKTEAWRVAT